MNTPTLTISISPASAPQNAASTSITWSLTNTNQNSVGGTLQVLVDGANFGSALNFNGGVPIAITLPSSTAAGAHSVTLQYSGDPENNQNPATSNAATFTVTASGGGGGYTTAGTQAMARPVCSAASTAAPSRADREIGVYAAEAYAVTAIAIVLAGSGRYDAYSVAVLSGTVAGVATRQALTITLNGSGGIASMTGFNGATAWDAPPRLTITRWDGSGSSATFLGY